METNAATKAKKPSGRSVKQVPGEGWTLELVVEPGRVRAHVWLERDESKPKACTENDVNAFVASSGLVLDETARRHLPGHVRDLVQKGGGSFVVAEATPPQAPVTSAKWHVPYQEERAAPGIGTMDLRVVSHFVNVKAGDLLCELVDDPGVPGQDVFGAELAPPRTAPTGQLSAGKLTVFDEEKWGIVALEDGCLSVDKGVVSVIKLLEIRGDVDYKVGNIDFRGDVKIVGNVLPGFHVKATGNISITGVIEDAMVDAGGDITIVGGAAGRHGGRLSSGGTIKVRYLRGTDVSADADVLVHAEAIDTKIVAGGLVQLGKGIIGGHVHARGMVRATFVGSEMAVPTTVSAGEGLFVALQIFPNVTLQVEGRYQDRSAKEIAGPVTVRPDRVTGGLLYER